MDDGTTKRLRSSKAEQPIRNRPGAGSTPVGASKCSDEDVIPPPSNVTVQDTHPRGIFDADGRLWYRRTGF